MATAMLELSSNGLFCIDCLTARLGTRGWWSWCRFEIVRDHPPFLNTIAKNNSSWLLPFYRGENYSKGWVSLYCWALLKFKARDATDWQKHPEEADHRVVRWSHSACSTGQQINRCHVFSSFLYSCWHQEAENRWMGLAGRPCVKHLAF